MPAQALTVLNILLMRGSIRTEGFPFMYQHTIEMNEDIKITQERSQCVSAHYR